MPAPVRYHACLPLGHAVQRRQQRDRIGNQTLQRSPRTAFRTASVIEEQQPPEAKTMRARRHGVHARRSVEPRCTRRSRAYASHSRPHNRPVRGRTPRERPQRQTRASGEGREGVVVRHSAVLATARRNRHTTAVNGNMLASTRSMETQLPPAPPTSAVCEYRTCSYRLNRDAKQRPLPGRMKRRRGGLAAEVHPSAQTSIDPPAPGTNSRKPVEILQTSRLSTNLLPHAQRREAAPATYTGNNGGRKAMKGGAGAGQELGNCRHGAQQNGGMALRETEQRVLKNAARSAANVRPSAQA